VSSTLVPLWLAPRLLLPSSQDTSNNVMVDISTSPRPSHGCQRISNMTIVITKGDNPGNYIYVDVNADFANNKVNIKKNKVK
jgi:hypothetical protein